MNVNQLIYVNFYETCTSKNIFEMKNNDANFMVIFNIKIVKKSNIKI